MKTADVAKHLDEDILGNIGGVRWVREHSRNQAIDWSLILGDEKRKSLFRASLQLSGEDGVIRPYCDSSSQISHAEAADMRSPQPYQASEEFSSGRADLKETKLQTCRLLG